MLEAQVTPLTPAIDQEPTPVGVDPPFGPVTVAVKVKFDPRVAVEELVVTLTVGVTLMMFRLNVLLGPAEL